MTSNCYHCGLPLPRDAKFSAIINNEERLMCCPGCQAVATAIAAGGLENFYQYRSDLSLKPEEDQESYAVYDLPEIYEDYIQRIPSADEQARFSIHLNVQGITCAACAWLIEHHIASLPGIIEVSINVSAHRAHIIWQSDKIKLSRILKSFSEIGYLARPVGEESSNNMRQQENRQYLLKLGMAGLAMMQTGMLAIGLYAGAFEGIDKNMENFLRWTSLLFATPVVFYSGQSFLLNAWRNLKLISFKHFMLSMDISISLALLLAYFASAWACLSGEGEIYFDAVSMFVFFLLIGRYLEMRVRHKNESLGEGLSQSLPIVTRRIVNGKPQEVPVKSLKTGDHIRISAGETLPCDGIVVEGSSTVSEALLTGESHPIAKQTDSKVCAGSINGANPLTLNVTAVGSKTHLSAILSLVERAQNEKPLQTALADKLAAWFVLGVLLIATVTAFIWWQLAPEQALWVVVSVLVVACPCALSLATPAALAVASAELRKHGFLVTRGHVIETLANVNQIVFDKTGTLTEGKMSIAKIIPLSGDKNNCLSLAAALEADSKHPIALAFSEIQSQYQAKDVCQHLGSGLSGIIDNKTYAIGQQNFISKYFNIAIASPPPPLDSGQSCLLLSNAEENLAWIIVQDQVRPSAFSAVKALSEYATLQLLSGDNKEGVAGVAKQLHIKDWHCSVSPEQKLENIQTLQQAGHCVLMIGDGINDIPVLSGANISVAIGDATDLTRIHADSILLAGDLCALPKAILIAKRTRHIIRQNLSWAIAYNFIAVCLAVMGWVAPWAAALGMSFSSLLVVLNAMRLAKKQRA